MLPETPHPPTSSVLFLTLPNSSRWNSHRRRSRKTAHPIVGRWVFPPNNQSGHAVIQMKLSMCEEDLASKLYEIFDIKANGAIITDYSSVFIEGLCLFTNTPGAPTLITGTGNLVIAYIWAKGNRVARYYKVWDHRACRQLEVAIRPLPELQSSGYCGCNNIRACACTVYRCATANPCGNPFIHCQSKSARSRSNFCLQQWEIPPANDEVESLGFFRVQAFEASSRAVDRIFPSGTTCRGRRIAKSLQACDLS